MAWKIVRNKDYYSHDITWRGDCPRFTETAILSIHISKEQYSKYDVQPTASYRLAGCNLLNKKCERDITCMFSCPVFEAFKNSHSY